MTQKDKQLLIKDLCARIPYHTFVQLNPGAYNKPETCLLTGIHGEKIHLNVDSDPFRIDHIKPYLRPMSSMTEEEEKIFNDFLEFQAEYVSDADLYNKTDMYDWLNEKKFDYRIDPFTGKTLIESDLAIEAPKDMYKNE